MLAARYTLDCDEPAIRHPASDSKRLAKFLVKLASADAPFAGVVAEGLPTTPAEHNPVDILHHAFEPVLR